MAASRVKFATGMRRWFPAGGALLAACVLAHGAAAQGGTRLLARQSGRALTPIAVSRGFLVWEAGPVNDETVPTNLRQRDLRTGRTRTLASNIDPTFGIASTTGWVVYVADRPNPTVFAVHHDGSHRHALAKDVATPMESRGELVAWSEQKGATQRIVVANLATGRLWQAARLARCVHARCYRVDFVTLADRGVVWTRGAVGPQPSFVMRRRFGAGKAETWELPGDPQPDLAASSAGALFYYYAHGWYRWDFGVASPTLTSFRGSREQSVLAFEHGSWYLRRDVACRPSLLLARSGGKTAALTTAAAAVRLARVPKGDCVQLVDLVLTGRTATTAWTFQPSYAINAHVDFGLTGAVLAGPAS